MGLYRSSAPAVEPVTTSEAKTHLRVDISTDDTYIGLLITVAREQIENDTKRALITQTWVLTLDEFPNKDTLLLPRPNLLSVTSIQYVDTAGVTQTFGSSNYQVDIRSLPGRVVLAPGVSWPDTQSDKINAVTITFTCGYGATAASVPEKLKQAIKLLVGHLYENREPVITGTIVNQLPMAYQALISSERYMEAY